jgi:hypothetical protein
LGKVNLRLSKLGILVIALNLNHTNL